MEHIFPLVCNMLVQPCHLKPSLFPAVTPLCFSGELPLETGQLFLGLGEILVVRVSHPIRCDSEGLDTQIKTYDGPGRGQRICLYIGTAKCNKILAAGIAGYRCRQNATFDFFGDAAFYLAEFRQLNGVAQYFDVPVREFAFVALPTVLFALKPGIARFLVLLHPAEEILEGRVQILESCLQGCGVCFL